MKSSFNKRRAGRSLGLGILLSIAFFYAIHVWGEWQLSNYRPDPETTSRLQLANTCRLFHHTHILSPNTGITTISEGVDGTKLAAGFINFTDTHIAGILVAALLFTVVLYMLAGFVRKKQ